MKKIAIAIIIMSLLSGCSKSFLVEKESCFKHLATLEKKLNNNSSTKDFSASIQVSKIFYSPKVDSCLYVLKTYSSTRNKPGASGTIVDYDLYNLLTKEKLTNIKGCDGELHCGLSTSEAEITFNKKVFTYE